MDTFLKMRVSWLQGGVSKLCVWQKITFYSDQVFVVPFCPFILTLPSLLMKAGETCGKVQVLHQLAFASVPFLQVLSSI